MSVYCRLLTLSLFYSIHCQLADMERMKHDLSKFLAVSRYAEEEKVKARAEISMAFEGIGLSTMNHAFIAEDGPQKGNLGHNLISIQAGPFYGTEHDKIVVVCANYDTLEDHPGVDDNGSGVAAVLETARAMATLDRLYSRDYTIIYALVDMKQSSMSGSHAFVSELLLPITEQTNSTVAGVIVLDGIMNFDPFPTSQTMPDGFERHFPGAARELVDHNHMGDFIQITARRDVDDEIVQSFISAYQRAAASIAPDWSFRPWALTLKLPMYELSSADGLNKLYPYLNADHSSFYFHDRSSLRIPTVYVSDTLTNRGVKQYCPYCDGLYLLNDQNMRFLVLVTDSVIRALIQLSGSQAVQILDEMFLNHPGL